MIRTSSSQLKAKLGRFMRAVRSGHEIIVTDRDEPVARLVPYRAGESVPPAVRSSQLRDPTAPPLGELEVEPIRYRGQDTTALLRADRSRR
jgi:prevent-host-death family protein